MKCNPPGSSVHGILQAWILKWVAVSFSMVPCQPRDRTRFLHLLHGRAGSLPLVPPGKLSYILTNNSRYGVAKKKIYIPFCLTLLLWVTGTLSFGRLKGFNSKKTSGPKSTSLGNFNFSCCTLKEKPYVVAHGKATSESWGHLNPGSSESCPACCLLIL